MGLIPKCNVGCPEQFTDCTNLRKLGKKQGGGGERDSPLALKAPVSVSQPSPQKKYFFLSGSLLFAKLVPVSQPSIWQNAPEKMKLGIIKLYTEASQLFATLFFLNLTDITLNMGLKHKYITTFTVDILQ